MHAELTTALLKGWTMGRFSSAPQDLVGILMGHLMLKNLKNHIPAMVTDQPAGYFQTGKTGGPGAGPAPVLCKLEDRRPKIKAMEPADLLMFSEQLAQPYSLLLYGLSSHQEPLSAWR
jgi:hypothetical protein